MAGSSTGRLRRLIAGARDGFRAAGLLTLVAGLLTTGLLVLGGRPAGSLTSGGAAPQPFVSTALSECGAVAGCSGTTLGTGQSLGIQFSSTVIVGQSYSLVLTDGIDQGTLTSASASATVSGSSLTLTLVGPPTMTAGAALSLSKLEVLSSTGITSSSGAAWNLVASGEVGVSTTGGCTPVTARVFGGSNCSIGFGAAGPTAPSVYDAIAVPTADLPGPPFDNAPEVITNCQAGSTDTVYSLATQQSLGRQACGVFPAGESSIGNTTSNTLDYIPTASLTSFGAVGVVEQVPGSRYLSATAAPPQVSSISISGNVATFGYTVPVQCQSPGTAQTMSQFTYASPWWSTSRSNLVYPTSITCPTGTTASTLTVTYPSPIPTNGVRFKYEGYGDGYFVVGSTGTALSGVREASQSMYVGPASSPPSPTITSLTAPQTPLTAAGGPVGVAFATANATNCTMAASPSNGVAISIPYTPAPTTKPPESSVPCPANGTTATVTLPPNSTAAPVTYQVTLTAAGLNGSTPVRSSVPVVVPSTATTTTTVPSTTTTTTVPPTTTTTVPPTTTTTTTVPPTTTTTTTVSPTTTQPPPSYLYDFEDGTVQGWRLDYGPATLLNTTTVAYSGTHALAIQLTGAGNPGVISPNTPAGIGAGSQVTYHLYEPAGVNVAVVPYAADGAWNYDFATKATLTPGAWTTVTWTVPALTGGLRYIGLEVENGGGTAGTLELDAVSSK